MTRVASMPAGVVSQTTLRLLAAELGQESPLPPFSGLQRLPDPSASPRLPPEMRERIAYGRLANPLPYALQNGYSRDLRPRDIPALRLANGRLETLVLPGLGGRLWSLRDLRADRDLVFSNRRLQFANFGLTDAWFAGGIEWNLGSTGHSATTSRPVFAGSLASSRGPALRIWEWERTRDLVFSVDLVMPSDRPLLLAFVRVRNPDPEPKPLYWWTNIAAAEEPGVRVLAPLLEPGGPPTTAPSHTSTFPSPPTTRPAISAIRYRRSEPQITSSRCLPRNDPGSPPFRPTAAGWSRPPPLSCAAASCSCGARPPAAGTGRSGCAGRGLATWRSRPVWPRRNSSTCGWRERRDQLGGGLRTDRSGAEGGTRSLAGCADRGRRAGGRGGF